MDTLMEYARVFLTVFRIMGPAGGVGVVLIVVGTSFLAYRVNELSSTNDASILGDIEQKAKVVFGDVSLIEPTEESRCRVREALAICDLRSRGSTAQEYDIRRFLEDLLRLLNRGHNTDFSGELLQVLASSRVFKPMYLQSYLRALVGLSKLIEGGQSVQSARDALVFIDGAVKSNEYASAPSETIINARGICNAILMRDRAALTPQGRLQHAMDASQDFLNGVQVRRNRPAAPEGEIIMYRFWINHAQWCAELVELVQEVEIDQAGNGALIMKQFDTFLDKMQGESPTVLGESMFTGPGNDRQERLLKSGFKAAEKGLSTGRAGGGQSAKRPAGVIAKAEVGVSALAWQQRTGKDTFDTESTKANVRAALEEVMGITSLSRDELRRLIEESPLLNSALKSVMPDLHNQLQKFLNNGK